MGGRAVGVTIVGCGSDATDGATDTTTTDTSHPSDNGADTSPAGETGPEVEVESDPDGTKYPIAATTDVIDGTFANRPEAAFDGERDQAAANAATTDLYDNLDATPLLYKEFDCETALRRVEVLISIVDRLRMRLRIRHACVVADHGMISAEVRKELEETGRPFILGARMRSQKEVRDTVLSDTSPFEEVAGPRERSTDPAPLKVKEVWVDNRRYVVCVNDEQAEHDRWQREQIVASLREQLKAGAKSFVGNKGYKRYLKVEKGNPFTIDEQKLTDEARFDGVWVLHTNTELSVAEVASGHAAVHSRRNRQWLLRADRDLRRCLYRRHGGWRRTALRRTALRWLPLLEALRSR